MKHNEQFYNVVLSYVLTGENREAAMEKIYQSVDNVNWRKYVRGLYSRMRGLATPEQSLRWNSVVEEITFRAVQW